MKYVKKPIPIEAYQFIIPDLFFKSTTIPQEFKNAICSKADAPGIANYHIHTLEGSHLVSFGDWILKGVQGEFYPCKPDIFRETYEEAKNG